MDLALDLGAEVAGTRDGGLEVRHLEPQERAVTEGNVGRRERSVVILDVDVVDLQDDLALADDLLVLLASVSAVRAQQRRVEAARRRRGRRSAVAATSSGSCADCSAERQLFGSVKHMACHRPGGSRPGPAAVGIQAVSKRAG